VFVDACCSFIGVVRVEGNKENELNGKMSDLIDR
jgi:hypothetical protein